MPPEAEEAAGPPGFAEDAARPRGRGRALAVLLIAAIVAVAVVLALGRPGDLPPPADPPRLGVAIDVALDEPAAATLQDVDDAAALGSDTVRVSVQWAAMEPLAEGEYADAYLVRLDALMQRAGRRDLEVVLTPVFTPCWAAPPVPGVVHPCGDPSLLPRLQVLHPRDPRDYADFVATLARRYRDVLAGVEVWNEPNLPGFWAQEDAVADYAELLRATHAAVERAAPEVPVVAGVLAGADVDFLEALYDEDIDGSYDALSLHIYNDDRAPGEKVTDELAPGTFLQGLRAARRAFERADEDRPIWLTEIGWNTSTQRGGAFLDGVDPTQQAEYLAEALRLLDDPDSGVGYLSAILVYRLRDVGTDPADPQQNYGLMTRVRVPKPALDAVRDAFARIRDPG